MGYKPPPQPPRSNDTQFHRFFPSIVFWASEIERQNDNDGAWIMVRFRRRLGQEHMEENLAIFDFELTDDEVKKLSDISQSMTGHLDLQSRIFFKCFFFGGGRVGG